MIRLSRVFSRAAISGPILTGPILTGLILTGLVLTGLVALSAEAVTAQTPVVIDSVVVTASPTPQDLSELGNHITLIQGDAIRASGVSSVADVLREVPGIAVVRGGSFGAVTSIFFRGGESDYVQVLVDGVQVNQPGGAFDFSSLTTENIERIEIVRGPSSALHGSDAVAGVIQIITRSGDGPTRMGAQLRAGSFGRFDSSVDLNGGSNNASWAVSLARYRTDGLLEFNNGHENTVLSGKATLDLDSRTRATVSARLGDRQYNFPTDFSGAVVDRNQFSYGDENSFSIALDRQIGTTVSLRALASSYSINSGTDDLQDSPADTLGSWGFQSLDAYRRNAFDLRGSVELSANSALTAGLEIEEQRVRSFNESLSQWGNSNGRSTNSRDNRAGYLHLSSAVGPVSANAGVRVEDNERYGDFTAWQLGLSLPIGETTRLRGVTGTAMKEPTFFETFAQGFALGNPDLRPETSTSWEVGVEQSLLNGNLNLQATWFDQSFGDLIQYTGVTPTPGAPNYYNVAKADSRGLELGASARAGRLNLFGDFTLLKTKVTDAGFASGAGASFVGGEALLRRPEQSGRLGFGLEVLPELHFDAVARYTGDRSDRDFNAFPAAAVVLDAYTLFDVSVRAQVLRAQGGRPGVELTLRGENLADKDYVEAFGFRSPGRGLYLGGRLTWGGG